MIQPFVAFIATTHVGWALLQGAGVQTPPAVSAESVLTTFAAALGLSLFIERAIELMQNIGDILPTTPVGRAMQKTDALDKSFDELSATVKVAAERGEAEAEGEKLRAEIASIERQIAAESDEAKTAELEAQLSAKRNAMAQLHESGGWDEKVPAETVLVIPATDPDDGYTLKTFVIMSLALAIGIVAAHVTHLELFGVMMKALGTVPPVSPELDHVLTGLFIGGGSGPVHLVMRFLTERKVTVDAPEAPAPAPAPPSSSMATGIPSVAGTASAVSTVTTASWIDVPYDGGVDRDVLDGIHHRRQRPNMVIVHHTAMHSESTFQDVVRVIKDRKDTKGNPWLTGYHCVVLADGSVHPFCRWDRYGNHASGYNRTSLGITFNGNFETSPDVPFSNPDGRYGIRRPTEQQLDAGARVVALWCRIYDIPAEFTKAIVPHRALSPTACPGNQFRETDFQKLVAHYVDQWTQAADARARIEAFKLKPYLFVTEGPVAWKP